MRSTLPIARKLRLNRLGRWRVLALLALSVAAVCLSGCGISGTLSSAPQSGAILHGGVHGGQQPVAYASIYLYAAGSSGNGTGATNLLLPYSVSTGSDGTFNITTPYSCPSYYSQTYIVAQGGNPGLPNNETNPALLMMAALGNCGQLSSSTNVNINEVTTVAAAWALAQFLGPGAIVGSSSTNATGLVNAFAVASNLADPSAGVAPGSALPSGAVAEPAKIYTLANAVASCVNSDGTTGCSALFTAATTSGGAPTNTMDAALNIVQNPASNVMAVYKAAPPSSPFQPTLSAQPHDWTMSITYKGGGLNLPGSVAIDSQGNVVVADYFGGVVSKFSPAGVPAASSGYPGTGLDQSYGIAVDGSDNFWVTNEQSVSDAGNSHDGSISKFSSTSGSELSGYGYTAASIYYPVATAADSNGTIWIADYGNSSASLLNVADGSAALYGSYASGSLPFTTAVAIDASHNAWFAIQGGAAKVTPGNPNTSTASTVSSYSCCSTPTGIAVDTSGNVWIADYNASEIFELNPSGSLTHSTIVSGGNGGPEGIAVDGAGNVWAANYFGNSLAELAGSNASVLSPSLGYGLDAPLKEPYGLAIDASGNVWLANAGSNTLTQFVGIASPVKTPLLGPSVQP